MAEKNVNVAINGFGRIGRNAFKIAMEKENITIVAINDLTDNATLAHLLTYDTVYGKYDKSVEVTDEGFKIDGKEIPVLSEKDPGKLPWKDLNVDVVIESTGVFRTEEKAQPHIDAGAKNVIISAPGKGGNVGTFVRGVNSEDAKDASSNIHSNASCTTNCIAPVMNILHSSFGVKKAMMTTIHGYTADQSLQDGPHKDLRRARAAAVNIIPTTTGAAIATTETIPDLKDKFDGMAIRVPVPVVSISDITLILDKETSAEEVNEVFAKASKNVLYDGILDVTEEPLVSADFIKNAHSAIIDVSLTKVVDGDMVKVIAWYDNEWGYSNRLIEFVAEV
ncbi:MAG: type I glyceraldehyde-3-phosphate dehydrogenase [Candidatus Jacksonbacteria bacterium]|jgi:glyceraldehyde 3-phosphate dehydrogenase|nr:type I glyceraldehyde-3-phosphate dehydrogenase [Candidatus Jacksonbacteria bacterium]MBT6034172.1 type I glyceraldehyde-3-phosphate dehydrogenase [Candidatus Jacksonbacteria bacterium]MBT6301037.1 type I glyceraldehyde-3-phosphate dehydrogenase [Candidatus Jacksonbacteria bacterium]MBT6756853.1 type I glyceraldehyde-3-phosphate dehydrogenase [Candidatus Jacksonbacteria bacterium]MBT6955039.1 type I glyceraldehyde-3-phosphate dehydrogenase [Candidatus Jacksonbacteria bacterium]